MKMPKKWMPKNPELLELYVKTQLDAYDMGLKPLSELQKEVKDWPREDTGRRIVLE
jgi:hypothetical protein